MVGRGGYGNWRRLWVVGLVRAWFLDEEGSSVVDMAMKEYGRGRYGGESYSCAHRRGGIWTRAWGCWV